MGDMSTLTDLAAMIPDAVVRLQGIVRRTPVQLDERLTDATGSEIWLKREDLQPVRSYKLRGAYNLMAQLDEAEREAGVVCASAGNHGQGVAYSAAALGIKATVVVPHTTPRQKRQRIVALGQGQVELVLHGTTYDEASDEASRLAAEAGGDRRIRPARPPVRPSAQPAAPAGCAAQEAPPARPRGATAARRRRSRGPPTRVVPSERAGLPSPPRRSPPWSGADR